MFVEQYIYFSVVGHMCTDNLLAIRTHDLISSLTDPKTVNYYSAVYF